MSKNRIGTYLTRKRLACLDDPTVSSTTCHLKHVPFDTILNILSVKRNELDWMLSFNKIIVILMAILLNKYIYELYLDSRIG